MPTRQQEARLKAMQEEAQRCADVHLAMRDLGGQIGEPMHKLEKAGAGDDAEKAKEMWNWLDKQARVYDAKYKECVDKSWAYHQEHFTADVPAKTERKARPAGGRRRRGSF